jgi:trehalose-phosphatase
VHFREVPAGDRHSVAMAVRGAMSRFGTRLGLRAGKCSLEVHPRIGWNKGSAVEYIRRELRLTESPVVCFGDDVTDESMFRVLAGHVTVSVGQMARTAAAFRVADPHAVGQALRALHDLLAGRRAAWEVGIA